MNYYAMVGQSTPDLVQGHQFDWARERKDAFEALKTALVTEPILAIQKIGVPLVLTTDVWKYTIGATLEQEGDNVVYLSHPLMETERRRHPGDQGLLAFLTSLRKWDVYLKGGSLLLKQIMSQAKYFQSRPKLPPVQ